MLLVQLGEGEVVKDFDVGAVMRPTWNTSWRRCSGGRVTSDMAGVP